MTCSAYIKKTGNFYEIDKEQAYCLFHENGASESEPVEDEHWCERFRTIEKQFTGVFVGTTNLNTRLCADWDNHPYTGKLFVNTYTEEIKTFAVVYYADNAKRLVPIDRLETTQ